jgi:hypothetical protein
MTDWCRPVGRLCSALGAVTSSSPIAQVRCRPRARLRRLTRRPRRRPAAPRCSGGQLQVGRQPRGSPRRHRPIPRRPPPLETGPKSSAATPPWRRRRRHPRAATGHRSSEGLPRPRVLQRRPPRPTVRRSLEARPRPSLLRRHPPVLTGRRSSEGRPHPRLLQRRRRVPTRHRFSEGRPFRRLRLPPPRMQPGRRSSGEPARPPLRSIRCQQVSPPVRAEACFLPAALLPPLRHRRLRLPVARRFSALAAALLPLCELAR